MSGRKKVLKAYRLILSWLHQKQLQPGDRLPAQIQLGQELGLCQGTLGGAMQLLVEDKVLKRRQKAGTVVLHLFPQNPHRRIWTAGIVMPEFGPSGYVAALTMQLHRELAARNFSDRTYFISPQSLPASEVDVRQPGDFLGLETDLEEGMVDALITSTRLSCDLIPCVYTENEVQAKLLVRRDENYFHENSVRELHLRGVRRIFLVGGTRAELGVVEQTAGQLSRAIQIDSISMPSLSEWAVEAAAVEYLKRSRGKEHCGVILRDDLMAAIFARKVAEAGGTAPYLCLLTYRGSFLSYPLPTLKFVIDLQGVSAAAVDLIVGRLLQTIGPRAEISIPITLVESKRDILIRSASGD